VAAATSGILVATDGSHDSDGAVRVGLALSRRDNVPMTMLSVVEPLPVYDSDGITPVEVDRLTAITRESRSRSASASGRLPRTPSAAAPHSSSWASARMA
jgi:nucleotide-binding universal stress UspA family protein